MAADLKKVKEHLHYYLDEKIVVKFPLVAYILSYTRGVFIFETFLQKNPCLPYASQSPNCWCLKKYEIKLILFYSVVVTFRAQY